MLQPPSTRFRREVYPQAILKDGLKKRGCKKKSLVQRTGLCALNLARRISGSGRDKENFPPPEDADEEAPDADTEDASELLTAARVELEPAQQKLAEAKTALKNTTRREKRAQATKNMLKERLQSTEALQNDLEMSAALLTRSGDDVDTLKVRVKELTKKNKALSMQEKGVFTEPTRELVMDLVSSYNVPVVHVDKLIKSVTQTVGVNVEGTISERTVGRVALEGGVIAQV
ncbi:hypothetical protein B0H14DRAFT_2648641 [Mycena olivaceomarginata]|nr:hypothetical protein B0H14DRAFT_2648641 [Mycena olivaceomarginata]